MEENTYFIDAESATEMARLLKQDRILTKAMNGWLSELPPERIDQLHDILDIGCGPGGWALDIARRFPHTIVTGIDISKSMIDYANSLARTSGLHKVYFLTMSALKLEFPENSFDLINARLIAGFMSRKNWPLFLEKCYTLLRPGGILRLNECEGGMVGLTNSIGCERLNKAGIQALKTSGRGFSEEGNSNVTFVLKQLLRKAGFQQIHHQAHAIDWSAGTDYHKDLCENALVAFKLLEPFLLGEKVISKQEFDSAYQQMEIDFEQDDFSVLWYFLTAWGVKA
jgi:ubiquinone/menaquinone biosynthesis C-methylase UbiE